MLTSPHHAATTIELGCYHAIFLAHKEVLRREEVARSCSGQEEAEQRAAQHIPRAPDLEAALLWDAGCGAELLEEAPSYILFVSTAVRAGDGHG